jgi:putative restriction endonuclease
VDRELDDLLRSGVFAWLDRESDNGALPLSWSQLTRCRIAGEQVRLIGATGIWKPRQMELPVSITTAPPRGSRPAPYEDSFDADGLLTYRYRGTDPAHRDNAGLRRLAEERRGLVYFHGIRRGVYLATWPVFVVEDRPEDLAVKVMMADPRTFEPGLDPEVADRAQARYTARLTRQRLHQADFRGRVLTAYRERCGFCHLRHTALLDAAHIREDSLGGVPATSNGLALCKIHHAAFDHHIIGLRPDLRVQVRPDVLEEVDGPMLRHGLQELEGTRLLIPSRRADRPDASMVEERYERFLAR